MYEVSLSVPAVCHPCDQLARLAVGLVFGSWFAQHYVLKKCSHPLVKDTTKFLLLVIAYFVRKHHSLTPKLSLGELAKLLGIDKKTVSRHLGVLCSPSVGELARHVSGKKAQYEMLKLAGPLFVDQRFDYAAGIRTSDPPAAVEMRTPDPLSPPVRMRTSDPHSAGMRTSDPSVQSAVQGSEVAEGKSSTTSIGGARRSEFVHLLEAVDAFLAWCSDTYPKHNAGAQISIDLDRDGPIVKRLLKKGRSRRRLQAMTKLLWTTTTDGNHGSNRDWIAQSDRSLRVLEHKADFLDREVVRLGLDEDVASRQREEAATLVGARQHAREQETGERALQEAREQEAGAAIDETPNAAWCAALESEASRELARFPGIPPDCYPSRLRTEKVRRLLEAARGRTIPEVIAEWSLDDSQERTG